MQNIHSWFRMPDIPKLRTLTGPKVVSSNRKSVASSDIRQDNDPGFLAVQELVREESPVTAGSAPQHPVQQVQPFTHFQAQPGPSSFQPQPAVPQPQPAVPQPQPAVPQRTQPSFSPQPLNRQPPVERQPDIRQPQPIPFQTRPAPGPRPAAPRQLVLPARQQPSPLLEQQAASDFFKDTLFTQPIEIPTNDGGASFSYEAILG